MTHLLWNTKTYRWIINHWTSCTDYEFKGPTFRISIFSEKEWKQVTEHKFDWFYAFHVVQTRSYLRLDLILKGYLSFADDALSNGVSHGLIAQPVGLLISTHCPVRVSSPQIPVLILEDSMAPLLGWQTNHSPFNGNCNPYINVLNSARVPWNLQELKPGSVVNLL